LSEQTPTETGWMPSDACWTKCEANGRETFREAVVAIRIEIVREKAHALKLFFQQ